MPPDLLSQAEEVNCPSARPLAHWLPSALGGGFLMGAQTSLHFQHRASAASEKALRPKRLQAEKHRVGSSTANL